MTREEQQKIIDIFKQMYGIHAIWFWGIGDIVRLQFSRDHVEFVEFNDVATRILIYFEEEIVNLGIQINELNSLPYVNVYSGTLEKPIQKTYVLLSDVISLMNSKKREFAHFRNNIKILIKEKIV